MITKLSAKEYLPPLDKRRSNSNESSSLNSASRPRMLHGSTLGQAAHTASGRTTSGLHQCFDWPETKADADIACVTMTLAFPWRPQAPKNEPPHLAADYELRFEPIKISTRCTLS